ncbi:MAG: DUF3108 domain-containing protein, partial [Curvibacter sp.]
MAVLAAVLALHWWLLGGFRLGLWPGDSDTAGETVAPLSTRMIPAPQDAPALQPPPIPSAPEPTTPAVKSVPTQPTETAEGGSVQPALVPESPSSGTAADPAPDGNPATESATLAPLAEPSPPVAEQVTSSERLPRFAFPPPVVLNYDVFGLTDGQQNVVGAAITWKHDGENYQASLVVTKFLINLRQWTSKGALTAAGLAPVRFGEKGFRRAEVASHFVRDEGRVIFSANSAPAPLLPGAQDNLSVFMQLASLWAGEPNRLTAGDSLSFQTIGPRQAETWIFVVSPEERITVPGGSMQAIKLTREATSEYSTKAEIWLAPQLAYLPAHIR